MATAVVQVERFQADLHDSDRATQQTVERMAKHIRECASDPAVVGAARAALRFGTDPAWSVWWCVKHALTFKQDDELLGRLLNDHDSQLELLISPSVMVRMNSKQGDCDDYTMLICCFLEALGLDWEIITVAADRREPWRWSHVYACAVLQDGSRIPLDASHGKYPGWQVPSRDVFRYQAWGRNGQQTSSPRGNDYRMHGYSRGRGMGDCVGGVDSDSGDPCTNLNVGGGAISATPSPITGGSTGGGFNWDSLFGNILQSGVKIAGQVVAPQTTIQRGPNGQLIITGPSSALGANPATVAAGGYSVSTGGTSSLLLIGGGALALILVVMLAKK
jgi:hypothetical protein